MTRLIATLETGMRALTGLAFAVLIGAVLWQVAGRIMGDSAVWTEELTRFALLFLAAFGAGLSFRTGDLVNVDLVCESLPGRFPWAFRLVSAILTAGLCLILIPGAWKYTAIGAMQTSPALGWRMDFIHASVLILLCSLALFASLRVIAMLGGASNGLPENRPEDAT